MAVIEGHAEHVMDAVAPDLLPSLPELRAALDRAPPTRSPDCPGCWRGCSGLDMKLKQYERGRSSATRSSPSAGPEALHHVFSSPRRCRRSPSWRTRSVAARTGVDGECRAQRSSA